MLVLIAFTEVKLQLVLLVQQVTTAVQVLKILIKTDARQDIGVQLGLLHLLFVQKVLICPTKSVMYVKLVQHDSNAREKE